MKGGAHSPPKEIRFEVYCAHIYFGHACIRQTVFIPHGMVAKGLHIAVKADLYVVLLPLPHGSLLVLRVHILSFSLRLCARLKVKKRETCQIHTSGHWGEGTLPSNDLSVLRIGHSLSFGGSLH